MPSPRPTGVLFVCLGNICRSPAAEGLFLHLARERGVADRFDVDSCGIGHWHIGRRPNEGSIRVARSRGVELPSIARQLDPDADFTRFDWLIAMDAENRMDLLDAGADGSRIRLLRSFDPALRGRDRDAPDPYGQGDAAFERMWKTIEPGCVGLLDRLLDGMIVP
ncbi:MAG: low molecular weight phosphotyrosine protein phosphatase [Phycisphaeraceae bacterium]|nr:low molecular weight phosphotyrosine protein phosphatase [Phycisphaeraceae bacterium]MCB9847349.1 low molecular weight phosphotyrosine protein phosphatase [Phycisphaeraceae bacterium]